jgi:hypothetical protein
MTKKSKKKKQKKALETLSGFEKRAEKLRDKAEDWEVNPDINKLMKKMGIPLKVSYKKGLSKKRKAKFLRAIKYKLTTLQKHFSSVARMVEKNPRVWDKKIKRNERKLQRQLKFYERITPIIFRKKRKK